MTSYMLFVKQNVHCGRHPGWQVSGKSLSRWRLSLAKATSASGAGVSPDYLKYKNPAELQKLISQGVERYLLLDVRIHAEYVSGHIPTALNVPYDTIGQNLPTQDRDALIIVYCKSGGRAQSAFETLVSLGYRHVVDFGGITNWTGPTNASAEPGDCPCHT